MKLEELTDRRVERSAGVIDGTQFAQYVETWFRDEPGHLYAVCTAIHRQSFDRRIGGVRLVRDEYPRSPREVGDLADAMTWKSALCGFPADGEKTIAFCHGALPETTEDKAELVAAHLRVLRTVDIGVIFGPDMNCDEKVMDAIAHEHGLGDHVSGLTEGRGGFSIDDKGFTARGLEAAMIAAADLLGWNLAAMTMTVQGFGAVGAHTARLLARRGVRVKAVSTEYGALYAEDGLPVEQLFAGWQKRKDDGFRDALASPPAGARAIDKAALFEVQADIFIPAARTDVLRISDELDQPPATDPFDAEAFWRRSGVRVVLEGANHPLSDRAEELLLDRGVYVLPDYLVNCGGLIGCWIDWCHREELQTAPADDLTAKAYDYIQHTVARNVKSVLEKTRGKARGLRDLTHQLAKDEREVILNDFEQRKAAGGAESNRAVALSYLDSRLNDLTSREDPR